MIPNHVFDPASRNTFNYQEYAEIAKSPLERLAWVLMKLDGDYKNGTDHFRNKFVPKIEVAFQSLPEKLAWQSFYIHDLKPYVKMDEEVKQVAIEKKLKKSQSKSLQKVRFRNGPIIPSTATASTSGSQFRNAAQLYCGARRTTIKSMSH